MKASLFMTKKLYFILLFFPFISPAQKMPETVSNNRVILNHKDSIIYAYLLPTGEDENIKANNEYFYCWYASHDIKQTQGGFDGRLLDGLYTEFYEGKELKAKGVFRKGLRKGEWKTWHPNGSLNSIIHYSKSLKQGKFTEYNQDGTVLRKGKYSKDKLQGKIITYGTNRQIVSKEKYKKGILIKEKEKKIKVKKEKTAKDSVQVVDKTKGGNKKSGKNKKEATITAPDQNSIQPGPGNIEEPKKEKKKKKEKDPQIKIRRGIRVYPQPGKST